MPSVFATVLQFCCPVCLWFFVSLCRVCFSMCLASQSSVSIRRRHHVSVFLRSIIVYLFTFDLFEKTDAFRLCQWKWHLVFFSFLPSFSLSLFFFVSPSLSLSLLVFLCRSLYLSLFSLSFFLCRYLYLSLFSLSLIDGGSKADCICCRWCLRSFSFSSEEKPSLSPGDTPYLSPSPPSSPSCLFPSRSCLYLSFFLLSVFMSLSFSLLSFSFLFFFSCFSFLPLSPFRSCLYYTLSASWFIFLVSRYFCSCFNRLKGSLIVVVAAYTYTT